MVFCDQNTSTSSIILSYSVSLGLSMLSTEESLCLGFFLFFKIIIPLYLLDSSE